VLLLRLHGRRALHDVLRRYVLLLRFNGRRALYDPLLGSFSGRGAGLRRLTYGFLCAVRRSDAAVNWRQQGAVVARLNGKRQAHHGCDRAAESCYCSHGVISSSS
jgi:hypothetical protein